MAHTPKGQKHIDLLLLCFLVLLVVMLVPLTVIYILAILRGGRNVEGINQHCGSAFHGFVVTNCVFNWVCFVVLILALWFLWLSEKRKMNRQPDIDAEGRVIVDETDNEKQTADTFAIAILMIGSIYGVLAIVSLAIVPDSMSRKACTDAIANVSWGSPLLGIVGYTNLAVDLVVALFCFLTFSVVYNFWRLPKDNYFMHKNKAEKGPLLKKLETPEHDPKRAQLQALAAIRDEVIKRTQHAKEEADRREHEILKEQKKMSADYVAKHSEYFSKKNTARAAAGAVSDVAKIIVDDMRGPSPPLDAAIRAREERIQRGIKWWR